MISKGTGSPDLWEEHVTQHSHFITLLCSLLRHMYEQHTARLALGSCDGVMVRYEGNLEPLLPCGML